MIIRLLLVGFAGLLIAAVSAKTGGPDHITDPPSLPAPSGNYAVGFRSLAFERIQADGKIRQLNSWLFYPATRVDEKKQRTYLADTRLLMAMKEEKYLRFSNDTLDGWPAIRTHSFYDALPASQKFPVVFILHGRGSSKVNYTSVAEELCSNGYVVVMADHPGSGLTILKDGTKVPLANPSDLKLEVDQMAKDACFMIDELPKDPFLSSVTDMGNIGLIGHSLGSMAMFSIALGKCDVKAAINFDGYPFGDAAERGISVPHMTLWGELPTWLSVPVDTLKVRRDRTWRKFLKASNPDFLLLKISGMYHTDFNDLIFLRSDRDRGRNPGAIDPQRGFRITMDLTSAYLNYRLKGGERAAVIREAEKSEEVNTITLE